MNITMKMKANIRREDTTKKVTKKMDIRKRVVQKRGTSMKITRDTRTKKDTNLTTLTTRSTERKVASKVEASMVLNTEEVMEEAMARKTTKHHFDKHFIEAFMCLITIQTYFHDTTSLK